MNEFNKQAKWVGIPGLNGFLDVLAEFKRSQQMVEGPSGEMPTNPELRPGFEALTEHQSSHTWLAQREAVGDGWEGAPKTVEFKAMGSFPHHYGSIL